MSSNSRLPRFYDASLAQRRELILQGAPGLSAASRAWLADGGLPLPSADHLSENVIGTIGLPLSVALNFTISGGDVLVAIATEEPSVVAAASNGARLVRAHGGFDASADASVMTAQVQLLGIAEVDALPSQLAAAQGELIACAHAAIPRMVARGGGVRDIELRVLSAAEGMAVLELHVDVGNAMGANTVDTVAEALAPLCARAFAATAAIKILTNLALRRRARARCQIPADAIGLAVAERIVSASRFAELDVARAATHNKGIMNGIVGAALALGQDTRAIEAGAHAFAAISGRYLPLATWKLAPVGSVQMLCGTIELPLATGIVGGTLALPHAVFSLELMGATTTQQVAQTLAAVGLASNLAALRALADEGIQRGHMRLHQRRQ
ncbi:MAG: hydroxymethylglutaryl-CoA reductase, degradative [Myxococcales bacterium]|nr:hydroxymethylglutaryl-CoA reductase, degradative [Myxococcales bacterium]